MRTSNDTNWENWYEFASLPYDIKQESSREIVVGVGILWGVRPGIHHVQGINFAVFQHIIAVVFTPIFPYGLEGKAASQQPHCRRRRLPSGTLPLIFTIVKSIIHCQALVYSQNFVSVPSGYDYQLHALLLPFTRRDWCFWWDTIFDDRIEYEIMDASLNAHRALINWKEHASEITDGWGAWAVHPWWHFPTHWGSWEIMFQLKFTYWFKPVYPCVVCCSTHHSCRSSERDKYWRVNKFGFFFKHNFCINTYVPTTHRAPKEPQ